MGLIVQKFGGSSVANAERINHVADIIADTYKAGNDVVVVLSAQGDTTDDLIEKAKEINPSASRTGNGYAAFKRRTDFHCVVCNGVGKTRTSCGFTACLASWHPNK